MKQQNRRYNILAIAEGGLGALVAAGVFVGYVIQPNLLKDSGSSLTAAIIGLIMIGYYASLHQILKSKFLATSTMILSAITAINVIVTIAQTGGLDSPFYIFWLLIVIIAGAFGSIETAIIVVATTIYFAVEFVLYGFKSSYLSGHISQLVVTILTGALIEWVYWRNLRNGTGGDKILEGVPSSGGILQADVLMSQMAEGVIVVDAQRRIQLFNHAAQNLTGWDLASAQGIDSSLVLKLSDLEDKTIAAEADPFMRAWDSGKNIILDDLVMTTKAGRKIQLNISVSPIFGDQQQVSGGIALIRDISREKAVERQRDEFVSTASHEMRTPVAAIEGYISLAMNANIATIDERARGFLVKAHDAVGHLGELFRDLLSVTKAEEGKLHGPLVAVNVTDLVQRAVDDMEFSAAKKSLTLSFQTAGLVASSQSSNAIMPIFWAKGDPERLREVVMNLIENAIKFTPQGGITISMVGDLKEVRVSVSDSGIGISEEDIGHLFQKFYRIDNSATRTIGGTGLGLYLCRTIIELFNGRIWATSKAGAGTTFHFSLPRLSDHQLAILQAAKPTAAQSIKTIMPPVMSMATGNPDTTPMTANPMAHDPSATPIAPVSLPIPGQDAAI